MPPEKWMPLLSQMQLFIANRPEKGRHVKENKAIKRGDFWTSLSRLYQCFKCAKTIDTLVDLNKKNWPEMKMDLKSFLWSFYQDEIDSRKHLIFRSKSIDKNHHYAGIFCLLSRAFRMFLRMNFWKSFVGENF